MTRPTPLPSDWQTLGRIAGQTAALIIRPLLRKAQP